MSAYILYMYVTGLQHDLTTSDAHVLSQQGGSEAQGGQGPVADPPKESEENNDGKGQEGKTMDPSDDKVSHNDVYIHLKHV